MSELIIWIIKIKQLPRIPTSYNNNWINVIATIKYLHLYLLLAI